MNSIPTIALHGFLGRPQDFQFFSEPQFKSLDYFRTLQMGPHVAWSEWADQFWQQEGLPEKINLMGYSLGGRLAMNAFARHPERVEQLVLISAGVWPLNFAEKEARYRSDAAWAEKFEKLNWGNLLREWNAQAVFIGSQQEPHREEVEFDRIQLAQAILNWSPAHMPDYNSVLREYRSRVSFVCGEFDKKYQQKFHEYLEQRMCREVKTIEQSGHRVISDQPEALFNAVQAILGSS